MQWLRTQAAAMAPAMLSLSMLAFTPVLAEVITGKTGVMWVSICSSDGITRTIAVPLGGDAPDDEGDGAPMDNCKLACHAACSRKDMGKAGSKARG